MTLLEVEVLRTEFDTDEGFFAAVDGMSFADGAGQTLAIVGESGSGKSVTALSIMGLVPRPPGRIAAGSIRFRAANCWAWRRPRCRRCAAAAWR
jgi:ABC-type dipeptide/oligopeptide/nickel transport system ATPase component